LLAVLCHGRKPSLRSGFEIQVLAVTDGKLLWQTDLEQTGDAAFPLGLAFMGNGVLVSSAEQAGPLLRAFAARTGKPLEVPDLKNLEKPHLAAAAEAPVLVAYSNLGLCVLRLDKKGQLERVFEDVPKNWTGLYGFRGAAVSPDGQSVLVTTAEECRVYRTENGEQLPPIRIRGEQAHFLADGKTVFVGFDGALVPVSNSPWRPRYQHGYMGHVSSITDLRYSPDGKRLASTDGETLVLWNPENGTALARMPGPTADYWIQALAFHPKESLVYASTGAEVWW
jgi:WD40 repeat protein